MTTLVVDELKTTLTQTFTLNLNRRYNIGAVRPLIYMHNAPSGTFTISIKSGANTLVSKSFTSSDIKSDLSSSDNYAWIWKALSFDNVIQLSNGSYTLELSSSGYSYSSSSYLGWIKEHENQFNETLGTPLSAFDNPYSFQLFEHRRPESFL